MWLGSNIYLKFYILVGQSSELALRNRDKDSLNFFFFFNTKFLVCSTFFLTSVYTQLYYLLISIFRWTLVILDRKSSGLKLQLRWSRDMEGKWYNMSSHYNFLVFAIQQIYWKQNKVYGSLKTAIANSTVKNLQWF